MKILVSLSGIFCFFSLLYFFIMNIILSVKSFKLFWKDRYDPKYEEIWGDRVLMFYPLFFPLKKMNEIVDKNDELRANEKIVVFLKKIKKLKISFIIMVCSGIVFFASGFIASAMGATWVG